MRTARGWRCARWERWHLRLVASLIAGDPDTRIVALVEPRMAQQASAAAAVIDSERIEACPATSPSAALGLDRERYVSLAAEITSAYHLAAIYNLAVPT